MNSALKIAFHRIEAAKQQLQSAIDPFTDDERHWKSSSESWSMVQVAEHLYNAEVGIYRFLRKSLTSDLHEKITFRSRLKSLFLRVMLRSSYKIKVPPIKEIMPQDRPDLNALRQRWLDLRLQYQQLLEEFPEEKVDKLIFKHPRAGMLSINQTLRFMADHITHHLHQIERIQQHSTFRKVKGLDRVQ